MLEQIAAEAETAVASRRASGAFASSSSVRAPAAVSRSHAGLERRIRASGDAVLATISKELVTLEVRA